MALYLGIANDGAIISSDGYTLLDANNTVLSASSYVCAHKVLIGNVAYRVQINLPKKENR